MAQALPQVEIVPLTVRLKPVINLTDDQLFEFCLINRDLRIERTAKGELLIMPPTGGDTGDRNAEITMQLRAWAKRNGTGVAFDSSTGFRLPNGAMRSRLTELTREQKFIPLCPDFVIELRSPSDSLRLQYAKMEEYLENGAQLGWLIDPEERRVHVYRSGAPAERLENPAALSGDSELPGFRLYLEEIWEPKF